MIVIQDLLLIAVQLQLLDDVVTLTLPVPPEVGNNWLEEESE
jgi:hypothetical protein